jgi:hypothetical protein
MKKIKMKRPQKIIIIMNEEGREKEKVGGR